MGMHAQLFGQSAIRLLDGGVDYSQAPPVTLAACLRQNGGADVAEVRRILPQQSSGYCHAVCPICTTSPSTRLPHSVCGSRITAVVSPQGVVTVSSSDRQSLTRHCQDALRRQSCCDLEPALS